MPLHGKRPAGPGVLIFWARQGGFHGRMAVCRKAGNAFIALLSLALTKSSIILASSPTRTFGTSTSYSAGWILPEVSGTQGLHCVLKLSFSCSICLLLASNSFDIYIDSLPMRNPSRLQSDQIRPRPNQSRPRQKEVRHNRTKPGRGLLFHED